MQPPKVRTDFLNTKPPATYVAGFTTCSDIGPARAAPDRSSSAAAIGAAPAPGVSRGRDDEDEDDKEYKKFHEINDAGLFASDEDKEADAAVWEEATDEPRMDSRRRMYSGMIMDSSMKEVIDKYRSSNPKITAKFADFKRKLRIVSAELCDKHCYSLRYKKRRFESEGRGTVLSDSLSGLKPVVYSTMAQEELELIGVEGEAIAKSLGSSVC